MENQHRNIIFIANIEWFFLKQRHQFLAEALANSGNNIIFIESSAKRNPHFRDIPRIIKRLMSLFSRNQGASSTETNSSKVKIISPFVLPSTNFLFNFINDLVFTRILSSKIKKFVNGNQVTIINYLPSHTSLSICKIIQPDFLIYDCVSNFEFVPGMPKNVVSTENTLIKSSDIVTFDCNFLKIKHDKKAKKSAVIPPGVTFDLFNLNLKSYKINKVLYFGLVSEKTDLELLRCIGNICELDIVGECRVNTEDLNISTLLHKVEHSKLPRIISNYDALVLPYRDTEYAKGVIPAKFFECLATGLPVIASATPNLLDYKEFLLIAHDGDYESLIENYIFDDEQRLSRIALAQRNDWQTKGQEFLELINEGL